MLTEGMVPSENFKETVLKGFAFWKRSVRAASKGRIAKKHARPSGEEGSLDGLPISP